MYRPSAVLPPRFPAALHSCWRIKIVVSSSRSNTRKSEPKIKTKAKRKSEPQPEASPAILKGWRQIATFLGLPVSAAQRWARTGMPIMREGRSVRASPEELNRWIGRETAEPVHIATETSDLGSELRRGLSYVKKQKQASSKNWAA